MSDDSAAVPPTPSEGAPTPLPPANNNGNGDAPPMPPVMYEGPPEPTTPEGVKQQEELDKLLVGYRMEKGEFMNSLENMLRSTKSPFQRSERGPSCQEPREEVLKCYSAEREALALVADREASTVSGASYEGYLKCGAFVQAYTNCLHTVQQEYYGKLLRAKKAAADAQRAEAAAQRSGHPQ